MRCAGESLSRMKLKPGIQTTEFWLTVATGVIAVGLSIAGQLDGTTAAAVCTLLTALQTIMRTFLKGIHAKDEAGS